MFSRFLACSSKCVRSVLTNRREFLIWRRPSPFFDFDYDRKFRIMLDVSEFNPRDIDVKVDGNKIKISAQKHDTHRHYKDSTQIVREYDIPYDVDKGTIKTSTESGVLVIEGERRITGDTKNEGNEKEFKMNVDLNGFKLEDISVKVQGDELLIEAKQDIDNVGNDQSQSKLHRSFSRFYTLPHNIDKNNLKAKFGPDGRLCVCAPYIVPHKSQEKNIDIEKED